MFNFLRGKVCDVSDNHITVDTGAIGYRVFCPRPSLEKFQSQGQVEVLVYTELMIREDGWLLYGFASPEEREWFKLLLTVQGVGAKVALSILSVLTPADVFQAIFYEDKAKLCMADGVGGKLALRIINELKDKKMPSQQPIDISSAAGVGSTAGPTGVILDVTSALVNLGYKKADILNVLKDVPSEQGFEEVFRQALGRLTSL
ncbi:MAG: Holliday junction branch migration protein RuvA [Holosporales bacterium]|jgi:Holliday junction DNA helicase RuvA|nr:Holliday junction branch migration protein RuvA [Holosporales bacterium]